MTKGKSRKIPELEIEILTSFVLGKPKEFSIAHPDFVLSSVQKKKLNALIKRRLDQEPLAYILGKKEFFGLNFKVNKNVLIPRPETEHLVEEAIKAVEEIRKNRPNAIIKIHELATGSGAVIISLAHELRSRKFVKNLEFEASDISKKALKIAEKNAEEILGGNNDIQFRKADILKPKNLKNINILIANPPYIPSAKIATLDKTIGNFEPKLALDGGEDGLRYYSAIFKLAEEIEPEVVLLELESINSKKIKKVAESKLKNYSADLIKDLAGRNRILKLSSLPSLR